MPSQDKPCDPCAGEGLQGVGGKAEIVPFSRSGQGQ